MKRWHRVLLGVILLLNGSQLFKVAHPTTELGSAIVLLISLCIIILSFWLFFGKIKKVAISSPISNSATHYKCVDCNKAFQESELKNDALFCPSCGGRVE